MLRTRWVLGVLVLSMVMAACSSSREVSDLEERVETLEAEIADGEPNAGLVSALEEHIASLENTNTELLSLVAALSAQGYGPFGSEFGEPFDERFDRSLDEEFFPAPDASGAAPQVDPPPDFATAVIGDNGTAPLGLGNVESLPGVDHLNFLFEFCDPGFCFRDAHFMDPNNPQVGSGPWTAHRPFHVRHGFISEGDEPLGEGFGVAMYVTRWSGPSLDPGVFELGVTYRYTADYVLRGASGQCGPTYRTQTGLVLCEWFVHDFPDALPDGRYDLWVLWEAPCSYWLDIGFADSCVDANEVISLFSAGVNSPFGDFPPSFTERNQAPLP